MEKPEACAIGSGWPHAVRATVGVLLLCGVAVSAAPSEEVAERARHREILRHANEYALQTLCMPQTGEPHPDPLPFPLQVLDAEMRLALPRSGVPIIPGAADGKRSLGFAACVWKDERGYFYQLNLAPQSWPDDPPVDVEVVGLWPHSLGHASEASLRKVLLRETRALARDFGKQYRQARGRTGR